MAFIEGTSGNDTLTGTDAADEMYGLDGKDFIHGGPGDDTINGGAGNDQLRGDEGDDLLVGGDGNDYISDGAGKNRLDGGLGDDYLVVTGTSGSLVDGGAGNDDLVNARGNDTLNGGTGNDELRSVLSTTSTDPTVYTVRLNGGDGNDEFYASRLSPSPDLVLATGGAGADTFSFVEMAVFAYTATDFDLASGDRIGLVRAFGEDHNGTNPFTTGHLRIVQRGGNAVIQYDPDGGGSASQFRDVIIISDIDSSKLTAAHFEGGVSPAGGTSGLNWTGTALDDEMCGGILSDHLSGGAGNDELGGGPSTDWLEGGAGDDFLQAGHGADTLDGGDGDDVLHGDNGDDSLAGGGGNDYLFDWAGDNVLIGGEGNDKLEVWYGKNVLHGGAGNDTLSGGADGDFLYGGEGSDMIDGKDGIDFAYFEGPRSNYRVQATYVEGTVEDLVGAGGLDQVTSVARLVFDDAAIAFLSDWTAMQVYCMYQAALNRVPDAAGVGYWIAMRERGISMHDIASAFITSPEFKATYGSATTNEALVRLFYQNTLRREPDAPGIQYWTDRLDKGLLDIADVLEGFSGSYENELAVRAQIPNGFEFIPYS